MGRTAADTVGRFRRLDSSSLGHVPKASKWEFDAEVTSCFDDMLARSIPQYDVMRQTCFELGSHFIQPNTDIVDLGCSRGGAIANFIQRFGSENRYIGVEVSQPMIEACRQRFKEHTEAGVVQVLDLDLRNAYPACQASLTLCVLILQFTPIEHRHRIVQTIYDHTVPGGAIVVVEKILGTTAAADAVLVDQYYKYKEDHGYSREEIDRKRLSLEGVLVPVTARWNEELLAGAGFRQVECFWRWMNFAGWMAVK